MKRGEKYWDDFSLRINETVKALNNNVFPPIRRVAVFITNKCNFRCKYCNMKFGGKEMALKEFSLICEKYSDAIIHITGGEPSLVPWLYDFIDNNKNIRFHLNTNAYLRPPKNIKRLKVSLDTFDRTKFFKLTNLDGLNQVVKHIKEATEYTLVSITYVLSKQTYKEAPRFMRLCRETFPKLYAVFFSSYKGNNSRFVMSKKEISEFWNDTKYKMEEHMDKESLWLFRNTLDERRRLIAGDRFPENKIDKCYLSMSEKVYDYNGLITNCSHLYRDNICQFSNNKHSKCKYGCNRKLVMFNQEVKKKLKKEVK